MDDQRKSEERFRILVIDDNRDAADSIAILLKIWGFEVKTVYNGREAFEVAQSYRPDCVLTDIGLPGLNGYDLAEMIRRDEALKSIPIIGISAYFNPKDGRTNLFDHHLTKPADPLILHELLRRTLTMDKRLEKAETLLSQQSEVIVEVRDLMKDVKHDVKEMKQELKDVKQEIKVIQKDLRDVKEDRE